MGKSAIDIEKDVRAALRVCSLEAKGLWCVMRYVIEESDRPGHLRQNGRVMSAVQLAYEAGCAASTLARLQQELEDAGLLAVTDRDWHSPPLARIAELRKSGAARKRLCLERKGVLRNTQGNTDVTPMLRRPPPPPEVSFPTPLSSLPPPTPERERGDRAASSSEIRSFATNWITANRPDLLKSSKIKSFIDLISKIGKEQAIAEAETVMADPAIGNPFAYALAFFDEHGNRIERAKRSFAGAGEETSEQRAKRISKQLEASNK